MYWFWLCAVSLPHTSLSGLPVNTLNTVQWMKARGLTACEFSTMNAVHWINDWALSRNGGKKADYFSSWQTLKFSCVCTVPSTGVEPSDFLLLHPSKALCFVQVRLRTEVLHTPSSTQVGFELMTSRSWQYISCHWDPWSNHSAISDFSLLIKWLAKVHLWRH